MAVTLSATRTIPSTDLSDYIMSSDNQVKHLYSVELSTTTGFGTTLRNFTLFEYQDGSEWVCLGREAKERFCGFLYLEDALRRSELTQIKAAANKMAIFKGEIIYLSRYYGSKKLKTKEIYQDLNALREQTGFEDIHAAANVRKREGVMYVLDTEKNSFKETVWKRIDFFSELHDKIRAVLKERLLKDEKRTNPLSPK